MISIQRTDSGFRWYEHQESTPDTWPEVLAQVDKQARLIDEHGWDLACSAGDAPEAPMSIDGWRYVPIRNYTLPKAVKNELATLAPQEAEAIWAWMEAGVDEEDIALRNEWKADRIAADLLKCWRDEREADEDQKKIAKPGFWSAVDDGGAIIEVEAETGEEAAQEYVDGGDWGDVDETTWINMRVWQTTVSGQRVNEESHTIALDPPEPECTEAEHEWKQTFVRGNGGGVIVTEQCTHCGLKRYTNTWAQNPATGEQGLESVTYEQAITDEKESTL
jgi:hypothetical protein